MGFLDFFKRARAAFAVSAAVTPNSADIPENDRYWRRVGATSRNLPQYEHTKACDDSVRAYQRDGFARRAVRMTTGFVVGAIETRPQIQCEDETLRESIEEQVEACWDDDRNDLSCRIRQWCDALTVAGELFIPVFPDDASGFVTFGYLDPSMMSDVICNPANMQQRVAAISSDAMNNTIIFPIIGADAVRFKWFDGLMRGDRVVLPKRGPGGTDLVGVVGPDVFYMAINDIPGQSRGIGDLYPVLDLLDLNDRLGFSSAERAENMQAFSWGLEGSDTTSAEDLKAILKQLKRDVEAGTGRLVAYKGAKLSAIAPQLQSAEWAGVAKMVRQAILVGLGFPESWYADSAAATFAGEGASASPVLTALQERQSAFRTFIEGLLTYAAAQLPEAKRVREQDRKEWRVELPLPVIVGKDTMRESAVLVSDLNALATAEDQGYLSKEAAQRFAAEALTAYGFVVRDGDQPDPAEAERPRYTPLPFPTQQAAPAAPGQEGGRGQDMAHTDGQPAEEQAA